MANVILPCPYFKSHQIGIEMPTIAIKNLKSCGFKSHQIGIEMFLHSHPNVDSLNFKSHQIGIEIGDGCLATGC